MNSPSPERDLRAADYVLGTLDEAQRAELERELPASPELQAAVYAWQDRLLPLSARAPGQTPAPGLWARIEASLWPRREASPVPPQPWWQRLGLWQGLSGLALAACLVLALLLVQRQPLATDRYLAVLQAPQGGAAGWVVELQAGGELRLLPVGAGAAQPVPAGRALQFWTKPEGAAGPTSLGLVQANQALSLPVARLPALGERQLFEITLEPAGGSPYDRPSGPILFVGRTVRL